MFSAYFDASRDKESRILTLGGFVSTLRKWERFEREWKAILEEYGIAYFHMTDFVSSHSEFSEWRGQSEKRRVFVARLVQCIKKNTNKGFCTSLLLNDYATVDKEYQARESFGPPYSFCGLASLGMLQEWAKNKNIPVSKVLVFVEDGDEGLGEFRLRAKQQDCEVTPLSKSKAHALAAGDLVAWKARTAFYNTLFGSLSSPEDAKNILRSLEPIRHVVQKNGGYDAVALREVCERQPIPKR
jgi:hypothetical protein